MMLYLYPLWLFIYADATYLIVRSTEEHPISLKTQLQIPTHPYTHQPVVTTLCSRLVYTKHDIYRAS